MSTTKSDYVPKEDRKLAILRFLENSGLVLTPSVIYTNMEISGATFSERTVHRLLKELVEEGYVDRPKRGYYCISDAGKDKIGSQ